MVNAKCILVHCSLYPLRACVDLTAVSSAISILYQQAQGLTEQ